MTIIHINNTDFKGGAAVYALNLHLYCLKKGYNSYFLVNNKQISVPNTISFDEYESIWTRSLKKIIKLITINPPYRGSWRITKFLKFLQSPIQYFEMKLGIEQFYSLRRTKNILKSLKIKPDVIHCHNLHGRYFNLKDLIYFKYKSKVIITLHDPWIFTGHCSHYFDCEKWKNKCGDCPDLRIYPSINRDFTRFNIIQKGKIIKKISPTIVGTSSWITNNYKQSIHKHNIQNIMQIPVGINRDIYFPRSREDSRIKLGLSCDCFIILMCSVNFSSSVYKGYDIIKQTLDRIGNLELKKTVLFLGIGEKEERFNIGNVKVQWLPYERNSDNISMYYSAADVLVHPSKAETTGLAIIESIACGTPVISSSIGGIPEVVKGCKNILSKQLDINNKYDKNMANGILIPVGSIDSLQIALLELMNNHLLLTQLSTNCTTSLDIKYDLIRGYNKYIELYNLSS